MPGTAHDQIKHSSITAAGKTKTADELRARIADFPTVGLEIVQSLVLFKMARKRGQADEHERNLTTLDMRIANAGRLVKGEAVVPSGDELLALARNTGFIKVQLPSTLKALLPGLRPDELAKVIGNAPGSAVIKTFLCSNGVEPPEAKAGSRKQPPPGNLETALVPEPERPGKPQVDVEAALAELSPLEAERKALKYRLMSPRKREIATVEKTYSVAGVPRDKISKRRIDDFEFYAIEDALKSTWLFPKHRVGDAGSKQTTVVVSNAGRTARVRTQAWQLYVKKFFKEAPELAQIKEVAAILDRLFSHTSAQHHARKSYDFMDRICPVLMLADAKGRMVYHGHDSFKTMT